MEFEKAKAKASKLLGGVSSCQERSDAFIFSKGGRGETIGGGIVAIMKSNGTALSMSQYAHSTKSTGAGKKIPINPKKTK